MEGSPHNRILKFTSARLWRGFGGNRLGLAIHPAHPVVFFENLSAANERKAPRDRSLQSFYVRNTKKGLATPSKHWDIERRE
jgi:hypothetical protein